MSTRILLTANAVRRMTSLVGKPPINVPPMIVQVTSMKIVHTTNGEHYYRAVLSDGNNYVTGMWSLHSMNRKGVEVQQNCIVCLYDYTCDKVPVANVHVITVLGFNVLEQATAKIGSPIDIDGYKQANQSVSTDHSDDNQYGRLVSQSARQPLHNSTIYAYTPNPSDSNQHVSTDRSDNIPYGRHITTTKQQNQPILRSNNSSNVSQSARQPLHNSTNYRYANTPNPSTSIVGFNRSNQHVSTDRSDNIPYGRHITNTQQQNRPIVHPNNSSNVTSGITPIGDLDIRNNRWTIQARITTKSEIKTWNKPDSAGILFSVVLLDSTSDIKATFFNVAVDKFYDMLKVGNVYTFSGGRLKDANMQFHYCRSQYESTFDVYSEIRMANDDGNIGFGNVR